MAAKIFGSYSLWLELINKPEARKELKELSHSGAAKVRHFRIFVISALSLHAGFENSFSTETRKQIQSPNLALTMSDFNESAEKNRRIFYQRASRTANHYIAAIDWLRAEHVQSVELSALRLQELEPLLKDIDKIKWTSFSYISFHAPSSFPAEEEKNVVDLLGKVFDKGVGISFVHPDVIRTPSLWQRFGSQLLLENMDRREI